MESARAFDTALPPDSERRLARIFCLLRQHERKAKAARKRAELQKLTRTRAAPSSPSASPASSNAWLQQQHPLQQTDRLCEAGERDSDDENDDGRHSADTLALDAEQHRLLSELDTFSPACLRGHKGMVETVDIPNAYRSLDGASETNNSDVVNGQQVETERRALIFELGRELRELQKGIIPTTNVGLAAASETVPTGALELSGCISAGDILSAMKTMGRSVSKVRWFVRFRRFRLEHVGTFVCPPTLVSIN